MERHRITEEEAFDRLRTASQRMNRKLRDLAEELARTGDWERSA
jgi:AmiR/NasT family two-component response regulator